MDFEDWWEEFGIRFGPLGFGFPVPKRNQWYTRTSTSHIFKLHIDPEIKKEEVKVRYVKPGLIEIEWPRKLKGEDIPVE